MTMNPNRRQWLKSSLALAAGVAAAPFSSWASPRPTRAIRTIEQDLLFPANPPELRARLFANENPFGPSAATIEAMTAAIRTGNRYPMETAEQLTNMILAKEQVKPEQLLIGPGSTQLLDMAAVAIVGNGVVLTGDPSYFSLVETVENRGGEARMVRLTSNHAHDLAAMEAAIDDKVKLVYVCNPNNPTGTLTETQALRDFCRRVSERVPVFVDEAYLDFLDDAMSHSMVDLVREGKQVIVSRTFSKIYGLAGMRIGYLAGPASLIQPISELGHVQWDISAVGLAAGIAAMQDEAFLKMVKQKNDEAKAFLYEELRKKDYEYMASSTNFVLFPIRMRSNAFQEAMMAEGIGIRVYDLHRRPYCRVSMGTMEEMELFAEAFRKIG